MEQTEEEGSPSRAEASTPQVDSTTKTTDDEGQEHESNSNGGVGFLSEPSTPADSVLSGSGGGMPGSTGSAGAKSATKAGLRRTSTSSSTSSKNSRATGITALGGGGSEVSWRGSGASATVRNLFRAESSYVGSDRSSLGGGPKVLDAPAHIALKAAGEGELIPVKAFLDGGGEVNVKSKTGASTLLSRAASRGHLELLNFLLERGAAVNLNGRGGMTPLHEAAGCGQLEACRVLLGAGAAVAARDYARRCPLHYAGSSAPVTRLLLDFGADPEAKDKNGKRPDNLAVDHEARALLRDARCAVRESGVGDNASRVIASLRRELEGHEREASAAKIEGEERKMLISEQRQAIEELRAKVSELTSELTELKQKALEAEEADPTAAISAALEAELKQTKAALKVARAAAAEEKSRREELEDNFDAAVAEAVAKAIAAAVAPKDIYRTDGRNGDMEPGGSWDGAKETDGDGAAGHSIASHEADSRSGFARGARGAPAAKQEQPPMRSSEPQGNEGGSLDRGGERPGRGGRSDRNRVTGPEGVLELFCIPTRGIPPEVFCLPKPQHDENDGKPCVSS